MTHLRVTSQENPYLGEGFSTISYSSNSGHGNGCTFDKLESVSNRVELKGMVTNPFLGNVFCILDETARTLSVEIRRVDLGLPLAADVEVLTWGPRRFSVGGTQNYMIEYRNDGLLPANDVVLVYRLDPYIEYISSTGNGIYRSDLHEVFWKLGEVTPKGMGYLSIKATTKTGIPPTGVGLRIMSTALINSTSPDLDRIIVPEIPEPFDVSSYLEYRFPVSTGYLTPEEFENELLTDPDFSELINYAKAEGYAYLTTARIGMSNETVFDMTIMLDPNNPEGILYVVRDQEKKPIITKVEENRVFMGDTQGGISIHYTDSTSFEISYLGTFCGAGISHCRASILNDIDRCFMNCVLWCLAEKLSGSRKDLLDILLKLMKTGKFTDCIKAYINSGKEDWDSFRDCLKLALKGEAKKVSEIAGKITLIIDCLTECFENWEQWHGETGQCKVFCRKCGEGYIEWIKMAADETISWGEWIFMECKGLPEEAGNYYIAEYCWNEEMCTWEYKGKTHCPECTVCEIIHVPGEEPHASCLITKDKDMSKFLQMLFFPHDPNLKYGPEGNVSPGQRLDYKVEYENEGKGIAYGVYFTDTLDEDLDDSTLNIGPVIDVKTGVQIAPAGIYNPVTRTITWVAGEVGPGEGGYAEFSVNVRGDAEPGTEIINFGIVYFPTVSEVTRTNGIVSIVPVVESYEMNLPEGWSMMSLPVLPDNALIPKIFPGAVVVYGYKKGSGYVRVTEEEELKAGTGYWILLNEGKSYTLTGQTIQKYTLSVNEDRWHMIGGCTYQAKASVDNGNIGVIYSYVQGIGYQRIPETENLMPGKGYWILISDITGQAQLSVVQSFYN